MSAYVVFTREQTFDPAELEQYKQQAAGARAGHPLEPLAFYGHLEVLEGAPIEGAVILHFPDREAALGWYHSPAYQAARAHRVKGADYRVFLIDGIDSKPNT